MTTLFNETIGGFRLLTEYRSFLLDNDDEYNSAKTKEFPSPYGVSFILMLKDLQLYIISLQVVGFRLLTEYRSFLSSYYLVMYFLPV